MKTYKLADTTTITSVNGNILVLEPLGKAIELTQRNKEGKCTAKKEITIEAAEKAIQRAKEQGMTVQTTATDPSRAIYNRI